MVIGVSVFAVLTAGIASLFVESASRREDRELGQLRVDVADIKETLRQLSARDRQSESAVQDPRPAK